MAPPVVVVRLDGSVTVMLPPGQTGQGSASVEMDKAQNLMKLQSLATEMGVIARALMDPDASAQIDGPTLAEFIETF